MDNLTTAQLLQTAQRMTEAINERADFIAAQKGIRIKTYTDVAYRDGIYTAARMFWKEGSKGNFLTRMNQVIKFGLNDAWILGAKDVGVEADEFEQADKDQIAAIIAEEKGYVGGLFDFLNALANNKDKKLADANWRLDLWCAKFEAVFDQARVWFNQKGKYQWQYGDTIQHCHSGDRPGGVGCAELQGIVAFGHEWAAAGIEPRSSLLSCGGLNCDCRLTPTTRRRSPRALQRLLDIVAGAHM